MGGSSHVAIISGGLGDIGRAIALELARRGADIAIGDILPAEAAAPLLERIAALGRRARYDRADTGDPDAVTSWVAGVEADLGTADWIIPNAAIVTLDDFARLTPEVWRRHMTINLDGAFYLARAAALRLVALKRPGRIVFIGSWAGHAVHTHIPAYCVTKAGLRMLMKCLAAELAWCDILVNEVAPGCVDAGLSGKIMDDDPPLREQAIETVPIHRLIAPEEVAAQVGHLCDPANRHMTGSVLLMDGGLSIAGSGWNK